MDKITDKTIAHKELKDDLQMSSESEEDSMSESGEEGDTSESEVEGSGNELEYYLGNDTGNEEEKSDYIDSHHVSNKKKVLNDKAIDTKVF